MDLKTLFVWNIASLHEAKQSSGRNKQNFFSRSTRRYIFTFIYNIKSPFVVLARQITKIFWVTQPQCDKAKKASTSRQ